jgi:hypothetical protein
MHSAKEKLYFDLRDQPVLKLGIKEIPQYHNTLLMQPYEVESKNTTV